MADVNKIREVVNILKTFSEDEWQILGVQLEKSNKNVGNNGNREKIDDFMKRTGFTSYSHFKGYVYMADALEIILDNPLADIIKDVYTVLANNYSTTPLSIERAIRHILHTHMQNCRSLEFLQIFKDLGRFPGNKQAITMIAEHIKNK